MQSHWCIGLQARHNQCVCITFSITYGVFCLGLACKTNTDAAYVYIAPELVTELNRTWLNFISKVDQPRRQTFLVTMTTTKEYHNEWGKLTINGLSTLVKHLFWCFETPKECLVPFDKHIQVPFIFRELCYCKDGTHFNALGAILLYSMLNYCIAHKPRYGRHQG